MFKTLFAFLLLTSVASAAWSPDLQKKQTQMLDPTVQIELPQQGLCSGTIVSSKDVTKDGKTQVETVILTAKHCVKDNPSLNYKIDVPVYEANTITEVATYIATVRGQDYSSDLALLTLKDHMHKFPNVVKIGPEDLVMYEGEQTWVVGYPLGQSRVMTSGTFGSREDLNFPDENTESEYFRQTADVAPGSSGGGLFHMNVDGDYEQIGVASAVSQGYPFVNFFTPVDAIASYLAIALKDDSDKSTPATH